MCTQPAWWRARAGHLAGSRAETLHRSAAVTVWLSCHKTPQWGLLGVDRGSHQPGGSLGSANVKAASCGLLNSRE